MKNNIHWFDSPQSQLRSLFRPNDQDQEIDDHWGRSIDVPSPTHTLPLRSHHPLSPWSHSLADPPLALPPLPPLTHHSAGRLLFSQDEEDLLTPVRQSEIGKDERSEGELHTTGRKSEGQILNSARISRPREKGLRKLSQRAFQIVQELRHVTYKEVAARLVMELNEDQFDTENKQEQNIKRRVYDALNVLIALGVLRKDGRKIVSNRTQRDGRTSGFQAKKLMDLKQKIAQKEQILVEKKAKFLEEQIKQEKVMNLLARNKKMGNEVERQKIFFPFIGVCIKAFPSEDSFEIEDGYFSLRAKQALQPFGDMDTFRYFKPQIEQQTSQQQILSVKKIVDKKQLREVKIQAKIEAKSDSANKAFDEM